MTHKNKKTGDFRLIYKDVVIQRVQDIKYLGS